MDGDLAGRVAGGVEELEGVIADPQRQVAREDDLSPVRIGLVHVAGGEDRGALGIIGGNRLGGVGEGIEDRADDHEVVGHALVVNDPSGALEVVVAEDVVDVVLGVHHVPDRSVRLCFLPHRHGPRRQLRGVDHHHAVGGRDVARVAATQPCVGADRCRDLLHRLLRRRQAAVESQDLTRDEG